MEEKSSNRGKNRSFRSKLVQSIYRDEVNADDWGWQ
jgi:hypothetical protein